MQYLCATRTRQASLQCLNRWVVFVYTMSNRIPFLKPYTQVTPFEPWLTR